LKTYAFAVLRGREAVAAERQPSKLVTKARQSAKKAVARVDANPAFYRGKGDAIGGDVCEVAKYGDRREKRQYLDGWRVGLAEREVRKAQKAATKTVKASAQSVLT